MAERGSVGEQTFERVNALTADGASRSDAFARVAEETGRTPGTVAAAFYRVARSRPDGGGVQQRPRKRRPAPAASGERGGRRAPSAEIDELVAEAHRAIDALAARARALEAESRELRDSGEQLARIRRVLG